MVEGLIKVEVAYAQAERQLVIPVMLAIKSNVAHAIMASKIAHYFPEINLETMQVGIFGQRCGFGQVVTAGDRVEIYRPLLCDPKTARRNRALLTQKK
ncbi:MAG: RnfH family protein [Methylococcales bacterium]|nr:RnfH family protein [Methylococcales bacterium]